MLAKEEKERFSSFKRFLEERRPADVDGNSPLGVIETFTVKLLNGPRLVGKVINRVQELMSSSPLEEKDRAILRQRFKEINEKDKKHAVKDEPSSDEDDGLLMP